MTLPSGGEIVIDKAEAMTVIDVNSSHYIATESHEQLSEEINLRLQEKFAEFWTEKYRWYRHNRFYRHER